MNKSYQEQIMEHAHINHQTDYIVAIKDCFAITRLEAEELAYARTAPFNESSREKMKVVQDEIKSILAKYNIEP